MIGRVLATLGIGALLLLALVLPRSDLARRGPEPTLRLDTSDAVGRVGETLPDLAFSDLNGDTVRLSDHRGQRILLTFERSLDW